jgi:predicted secreted protein
MNKNLRKPKLSPTSLANTSFNWSRFFGYAYCFICACAVVFISPQEKMNQQKVSIDQHNTTIELNEGEILQIELPGNVKKGFEWRLHELDETILDLTDEYNQMLEEENPVFAEDPNLEHWAFKTVQTGSSKVRILYYRPWEGKGMVEKNFYIKTVGKL